MSNLRNYLNFSLDNAPPVEVGGVRLTGFGQHGMLGMPGDFTPPSRFVRAVAYSTSVLPSKTGPEAVLQAFHILNNFDIPEGSSREQHTDAHGNVVADHTLWTSASDLKQRRFYFRTYESSQIRSVDLMKMPLDAKTITTISMKGPEMIKSLEPITGLPTNAFPRSGATLRSRLPTAKDRSDTCWFFTAIVGHRCHQRRTTGDSKTWRGRR